MNALQLKALSEVSNSLGINQEDLYKLIQFESKWNPAAKNPLSSARGLLQFTDATAKNLGYRDSLDLITKNNSIESQLYFPVLQYLSQFKPFKTKQSLYMSVFYPDAREWPLYQEFPEKVKKNNPGIRTVADYVNKVENKKPVITAGLLSLIAFAAIILLMKGE
jgi:hypothetical protein